MKFPGPLMTVPLPARQYAPCCAPLSPEEVKNVVPIRLSYQGQTVCEMDLTRRIHEVWYSPSQTRRVAVGNSQHQSRSCRTTWKPH